MNKIQFISRERGRGREEEMIKRERKQKDFTPKQSKAKTGKTEIKTVKKRK